MVNLFNPDENTFNFMLQEVGKELTLNGSTPIKAILSSIPVNDSNHDDKYISTLNPIKQGDMVDFNLSKWLVVSQVNGMRTVKYKGIMRKCNYSIKFNFLGNVKPFPAIITTKMLDIQTGQWVSFPIGKILVSLQDNVDTRDIVLSQRFIIMGSAWKVVGIDKSVEGLIILNADLTTINSQYDDKINEIADRWTYEITHSYALNIVGETASVNINDISSVSAIVTDNGVTMVNPALTYFSSDPSIVSIDNTGHIQGISLGNCTITCQMTGKPEIKDTIAITVQDAPVGHSYSIAITTGPSTIKLGQSASFVATFYDNGAIVTDQSATWSIVSPNPDATTNAYATITSSTGTSAAVKATGNASWINKYFVLKCTLVSDPSISITKQIQIKSLI